MSVRPNGILHDSTCAMCCNYRLEHVMSHGLIHPMPTLTPYIYIYIWQFHGRSGCRIVSTFLRSPSVACRIVQERHGFEIQGAHATHEDLGVIPGTGLSPGAWSKVNNRWRRGSERQRFGVYPNTTGLGLPCQSGQGWLRGP